MAKLAFLSDSNPTHASEVIIDTADVLAVENMGYAEHVGGVFAHRRKVYFRDGVADNGGTKVSARIVWGRSTQREVPPSMATLDNFGGKQKIAFAQASGSNSSELATATSVAISVDPSDLKDIKRLSASARQIVAGTGFSAAFTRSGQPETIRAETPVFYATIQLGEDTHKAQAPRIPIAHLDRNRGAALKVLECH